MTERFCYRPVPLAIKLIQLDDQTIFATLFPAHQQWLADHAIGYQVSCYRWPQTLALLFGMVGQTICEVRLEIAAESAQAFAAFSGLRPV